MEQSVHGAITSAPDAAYVTNAQPIIAWIIIAALFDVAIAAIVLSVVLS